MAGCRPFVLSALLLAGCASVPPLETRFEGSVWRIRSINSEATPIGTGYRVEFNPGGVFAAGLGCNGHMGEYRIVDGRLIVGRSENTVIDSTFHPGRLIGTERDCPGTPGERFEPMALGILRFPLTPRWLSSNRLVLSNSVGTIELGR